MKFTKKQALEAARAFQYTLEKQVNATPVLYYYRGKIGFSPGSQTGGTAEPVYNGKADILVSANDFGEWRQDLTLRKTADNIHYKVNAYLHFRSRLVNRLWKRETCVRGGFETK